MSCGKKAAPSPEAHPTHFVCTPDSCILYASLRLFPPPSPFLARTAAVRSPNFPVSACSFNHTLHSSAPSSGFPNCHSMIRSRMPLTIGPGEIPRTSHTALPYMGCETLLGIRGNMQLRTDSKGGESTASWSLYSSIRSTNAVYLSKRAVASSSTINECGKGLIRKRCVPWYSPASVQQSAISCTRVNRIEVDQWEPVVGLWILFCRKSNPDQIVSNRYCVLLQRKYPISHDWRGRHGW